MAGAGGGGEGRERDGGREGQGRKRDGERSGERRREGGGWEEEHGHSNAGPGGPAQQPDYIMNLCFD